ncbi:MAG: effector binding domain-containing protein [Pseudomonadota bacterium]
MTPGKTELVPYRFHTHEALHIKGLSRFHPFDEVDQIADQWGEFAATLKQRSAAVPAVTFGIIYDTNKRGFHYLSGIETLKTERETKLTLLSLPPQTYAVFAHADHVATLRDTCDAIWADWVPHSKRKVVEGPWFERYGSAFDPATGTGGVEIWIPLLE